MRTIPSDEQILADYERLGSASACARYWSCAHSTSQNRIAAAKRRIAAGVGRPEAVFSDGAGHPRVTDRVDAERVNRVEELLQKANVDPLSIRAIKKVVLGAYGAIAKNKDGEVEEHGLYNTRITIDPNADQPFPLIQPATPTTIKFAVPPRILRKIRTEVVISDMQVSFVNLAVLPKVQLDPMHDLAAIRVAQAITRDMQPKRLICIGDAIDWTMFSRWPKQPEQRGCTQASVDAAYLILGEFRSAAGKQLEEYIMLGSNHQARPALMVRDMNLEAMGMQRACEPESWPVFSEENLCRYEDLGIKFSGQYPGGAFYILDDLVAMHAPPKRLEFAASVLHGHTHKVMTSPAVTHGRLGRQVYFTHDTGCLCRVGSVEDTRRHMQTIVSSDRARTNWQNGIAVVSILEGKIPRHQVDLIHIDNGTALYGGQVYEAEPAKVKEAA